MLCLIDFLLFVPDEAAVSCENEPKFKRGRLQWGTQNIACRNRSDRFTSYVLPAYVLRVCPETTLLRHSEGTSEECGLCQKNRELPDG